MVRVRLHVLKKKMNTYCKILIDKTICFGMLWSGILSFKKQSKNQIWTSHFYFRGNDHMLDRERMKTTRQFQCTYVQKHMLNISLEIIVTQDCLQPWKVNMVCTSWCVIYPTFKILLDSFKMWGYFTRIVTAGEFTKTKCRDAYGKI